MTDLRPCPNPECRRVVGPRLWPLTPEWPYATVECRDCLLLSPRCDSDAEAARLYNALPRKRSGVDASTHSEFCWRWHLDCAVAKVEAQAERIAEAIIDEKRNAETFARLERENAELQRWKREASTLIDITRSAAEETGWGLGDDFSGHMRNLRIENAELRERLRAAHANWNGTAQRDAPPCACDVCKEAP